MDISNEHHCPGKCGAAVPNRLFACKPCWAKLPHELRQNIVHTRRMHLLSVERLIAVHAAEDYYAACTGDAVVKGAQLQLGELYGHMLEKVGEEYARTQGATFPPPPQGDTELSHPVEEHLKFDGDRG